jgi:hypothetical protein
MAEDEVLSEEDKQVIRDSIGYGGSVPDSKQNVHTFLHSVATADDTTKLGFLKEEEIGMMPNPIRSYKHLAQFANDIMHNEGLSNFFKSNSEIVTSTSLSRQGFLIDRAVVQKRELRDSSNMGEKKQNSSWFKSKDDKKEGVTPL